MSLQGLLHFQEPSSQNFPMSSAMFNGACGHSSRFGIGESQGAKNSSGYTQAEIAHSALHYFGSPDPRFMMNANMDTDDTGSMLFNEEDKLLLDGSFGILPGGSSQVGPSGSGLDTSALEAQSWMQFNETGPTPTMISSPQMSSGIPPIPSSRSMSTTLDMPAFISSGMMTSSKGVNLLPNAMMTNSPGLPSITAPVMATMTSGMPSSSLMMPTLTSGMPTSSLISPMGMISTSMPMPTTLLSPMGMIATSRVMPTTMVMPQTMGVSHRNVAEYASLDCGVSTSMVMPTVLGVSHRNVAEYAASGDGAAVGALQSCNQNENDSGCGTIGGLQGNVKSRGLRRLSSGPAALLPHLTFDRSPDESLSGATSDENTTGVISPLDGGFWDEGNSWNMDPLTGRKRVMMDIDVDNIIGETERRTLDFGRPKGNLIRHASLPTLKSRNAAVLTEDVQSVPMRSRAKRGMATHPRSIAERVRRTKISEKMRKLQELVPNMDKQQTNTADMLEEAVEYVKHLQRQVQEITDKCAELANNRPTCDSCKHAQE